MQDIIGKRMHAPKKLDKIPLRQTQPPSVAADATHKSKQMILGSRNDCPGSGEGKCRRVVGGRRRKPKTSTRCANSWLCDPSGLEPFSTF